MAKGSTMVAALAALALAAIGCGSDGEQAAGAASQTGDPAAAPPAGQATTADGSAPGSGDAATAQALASRNATIDANPVRLEIAELRRSGTTVALTLRLSTTSDDTTDVGDVFDDGVRQIAKGTDADDPLADDGYRNGNSVDGVALIDATNRRKHLVGRDAQGNCLCDVDIANASVMSDAPLLLSATYAAPPPDVKEMDVFVPRFGTFKRVALQG